VTSEVGPAEIRSYLAAAIGMLTMWGVDGIEADRERGLVLAEETIVLVTQRSRPRLEDLDLDHQFQQRNGI
jgi:hypothetical protein